MTTHLKTIPTRDAEGNDTGILVPIWNKAFDHRKVKQVYITTILPGKQKGPHLHKLRAGAFTPLVGRVLIVTRENGMYHQHICAKGFKTIHVPEGVPACLYNIGSEPAMVLNTPSKPWRNNSDEHKVTDWEYEFWPAASTIEDSAKVIKEVNDSYRATNGEILYPGDAGYEAVR